MVQVNKTQEGITRKTHLQQELHHNLLSGRFSILLKSHHYLPIILDSYQSINNIYSLQYLQILDLVTLAILVQVAKIVFFPTKQINVHNRCSLVYKLETANSTSYSSLSSLLFLSVLRASEFNISSRIYYMYFSKLL